MKQTKSKNRTIKSQSNVFARAVDLKDKRYLYMYHMYVSYNIQCNKRKVKKERSRPSQVCL